MATAEFTVTRKELMAELDRLAKERLGIAGSLFIERYNAGELDVGDPTVEHLAIFARLINDSPQGT